MTYSPLQLPNTLNTPYTLKAHKQVFFEESNRHHKRDRIIYLKLFQASPRRHGPNCLREIFLSSEVGEAA